MRIADSVIHSMGGFEIEAGEIGTSSTNKYKITLPYTGTLPACLAGVESAAVQISVGICLEYRAFLLVKLAGVKKPRSYRLEATPAEVESILTGLIYDDHRRPDGGGYLSPSFKGSGLTGYWLGYTQAQLTTRQQIRKNPSMMDDEIITSILQGVSPERLQEIIDKRHPRDTK